MDPEHLAFECWTPTPNKCARDEARDICLYIAILSLVMSPLLPKLAKKRAELDLRSTGVTTNLAIKTNNSTQYDFQGSHCL